jgi:hypothetical protein
MKMTTYEGTAEEILYVQQRLVRDGAIAIISPADPEQVERPNAVKYPNVDVARDFLRRRPLSKDQLTFFRALYKAHPAKVHANDLRKAMNHSKPNELTGVLGALGRRFANTDGDGEEFMTWETTEEGTSYGLPDTVRQALKVEGLV